MNTFHRNMFAFAVVLCAWCCSTSSVGAQDCPDNLVTFTVAGGTFINEISFIVTSSNGLAVLQGNGYSGTLTACLPDGCYVINMYDSFGDGWNGGSVTVASGGAVITVATLATGDSGYTSFGLNDEGCSNSLGFGCTDPNAYNYDDTAVIDDGSCTYAGCTDPAAINYDYSASVDDGSCEYCDGEGSVIAQLYVCTFSNGGEVELQIVDDAGNEVIYVSNLGNSQIAYFDICLSPGTCYTVNMINNTCACGWYGGYYWVNAAGLQVSIGSPGYQSDYDSIQFSIDGTCGPVYGCMDPNAYNYDPLAEVNDGSCVYAGCTDPAALNYNYYATIDDGSCEYCDNGGEIAQLYICAFANGSQIQLQILDDEGNEVYFVSGLNDYQILYASLCLQAGTCYTVIMTNNSGNTGWYGGYFWISGNDGYQLITASLGENDTTSSVEFSIDGTCGPVFGCTDPAAVNYNPDATMEDGSCVYPYYGCTDPAALNYNPYANADDGSCEYGEDCLQNLVTFSLTGSFWPYEMSYSVYDSNGGFVLTGLAGNAWACIADGCYTIYMYDTYGDGWDSGILDIYVNGVYTTSATLVQGTYGTTTFGVNTEGCEGVMYGCTDQAALNYNYYATANDGSCVYPEDCNANLITIFIATEIWGSEVSWNLVAEDGTVVASGSGYDSWSVSTTYVCLEDGCYTLQMNDSWGDGWNGAYYMIWGNGTYAEGSLLYGDYASDQIGVNTTCEIDGCTDPEALNYNPYATIDDGSCIYNDNGEFNGDDWAGMMLDLTSYPNPTDGDLNVMLKQLDAQSDINMNIMNITGQVVRSMTFSNEETFRTIQLDLNDLSSGYYMMNVQNGGRNLNAAIVKE